MMGAIERRLFWHCCFAILALLSIPTFSFALNVTPASSRGLFQTYGFVIGQEKTLRRIENELPKLAVAVALARAQFEATFPRAKQKLEAVLVKAMGEQPFNKTAAELQAKVGEVLGSQKLTSELANQFLQQVGARAKGDIESPTLQYLLAVQYEENPVGEFLDGFRQHYQTHGTGKSQGIRLRLQVPQSWAAKEGERPHIVQKWGSENGTGLEMILLDIRDAGGYEPAKKDIEDFVRSGEVNEVVPEGGAAIATGVFSLEKRTGYWIHMAMPAERAGLTIHQETLLYQLFFRGKAIGLMCSVGRPENEKAKVTETFNRTRPLCQQVLNSLVLLQAY